MSLSEPLGSGLFAVNVVLALVIFSSGTQQVSAHGHGLGLGSQGGSPAAESVTSICRQCVHKQIGYPAHAR
jgi:hypothetical protein